jgi:hypothetical protein
MRACITALEPDLQIKEGNIRWLVELEVAELIGAAILR